MIKRSNNNPKVSILFYEPSSGFGGSANALAHIINLIDREKFHPIVAVANIGSQTEKIKNTDIIKVGCLNVLKLYLIIKSKKVDIVHVNTNVLSGIPAIIAARLANIPCVCHIRQTRTLMRRERMFANFVTSFILINNNALSIYGLDIPIEKLHLVYDGVNLAEFESVVPNVFRSEYKWNDAPIIGLVGRIVAGKGQKEFVLAAKEVIKKRPDAKFLIVGSAKGDNDSYYQEVKTLVVEHNLENVVFFTGWRTDVTNVMSSLDVLVLSTTTFPEGLPNTMIEAMALKKPVVASNIPGPADIVLNGETGFLVPPQQPNVLAKAIIDLISDPDLAKRMGANGRKRVEELFDARKSVRKIEELYERTLCM